MDAHLEPAITVIRTCGGFDAVATITGRHISRVYRWALPKDRGGTGGTIPQPEAAKLLAHATKAGLPITAASFFGAAA